LGFLLKTFDGYWRKLNPLLHVVVVVVVVVYVFTFVIDNFVK